METELCQVVARIAALPDKRDRRDVLIVWKALLRILERHEGTGQAGGKQS